MDKNKVIEILNLEPLTIEGGFFNQVYKSALNIPKTSLPERFKADSYTASTSIYYLLGGNEKSSMHSLSADETWHFYTADSASTYVLLTTIDQTGLINKIKLGANIADGQKPQYTILASIKFGAKIVCEDANTAWVLCGATVAPSFEYADFTAHPDLDVHL